MTSCVNISVKFDSNISAKKEYELRWEVLQSIVDDIENMTYVLRLHNETRKSTADYTYVVEKNKQMNNLAYETYMVKIDLYNVSNACMELYVHEKNKFYAENKLHMQYTPLLYMT